MQKGERMYKHILILICFVFLFLGCAKQSAIWIYPNEVSEEQMMKDDLLCKQDMQVNILHSSGVITDARRRAIYYNNCMKLKGYKKSVVPRKEYQNPVYRWNISHPM